MELKQYTSSLINPIFCQCCNIIQNIGSVYTQHTLHILCQVCWFQCYSKSVILSKWSFKWILTQSHIQEGVINHAFTMLCLHLISLFHIHKLSKDLSFTVLCHEVQPTANSWECSKIEFQPILFKNFDQATFMCICFTISTIFWQNCQLYMFKLCVYILKRKEKILQIPLQISNKYRV